MRKARRRVRPTHRTSRARAHRKARLSEADDEHLGSRNWNNACWAVSTHGRVAQAPDPRRPVRLGLRARLLRSLHADASGRPYVCLMFLGSGATGLAVVLGAVRDASRSNGGRVSPNGSSAAEPGGAGQSAIAASPGEPRNDALAQSVVVGDSIVALTNTASYLILMCSAPHASQGSPQHP